MEVLVIYHSKLHSKLSWKTTILLPSMIMCYQGFYSLNASKRKALAVHQIQPKLEDKGENIVYFYVSELYIDIGTCYWNNF